MKRPQAYIILQFSKQTIKVSAQFFSGEKKEQFRSNLAVSV